MTNHFSTKTWNYNVAVSVEGDKATDIIVRLGEAMNRAREFALMAKTALHAAVRYRSTYEIYIKRPETKARRAVINKASKLCTSYFAKAEAFAFFGNRAVQCLDELEAVMPHLIRGGEHYDSTEPSYGRKCNAVLASRLILSIPSELKSLADSFNMSGSEEYSTYVWVGRNDLFPYVCDARDAARFDELDIPYIPAASDNEAMQLLDGAMERADETLKRAAAVVKEYSDAKARYFSDRWDPSSPLSSSDAEEFFQLQVQFELADWALKNAIFAFYQPNISLSNCIHLAEAAVRRLPHCSVLRNNVVAARCKQEAITKCCSSMRKLAEPTVASDGSGRRDSRYDLAYGALEGAFNAIPARHRRTSVQFLENPARR